MARKLAADDRRLSDNSILNLITGYNGLGRIFGSGGPGKGAGGGGGGGNFSGATGVLRLFNSAMGGQASWLLPAALLALGAGLIVTRGAPRTDRTRAALLLWGSWLAVSGVVFSPVQRDHPHLLHGRPHPRDRGAGGDRRADAVGPAGHRAARVTAGVAVAVSAGWAWALLDRTPSREPWLRTAILVGGAASVATLLVSAMWRALRPRLAVAAVIMGVVASVAGPVAYAAQTIATPHTGSVPSAGPASAGGMGGGFGGGARPGGMRFTGGRAHTGAPGGGTTVSAALKRALETNASQYRWVAATSGSQSAASLELATGGEPVMAIGGCSGQGGELTLAQFQTYAKAGGIHYYIASDGAGAGAGGRDPAVRRARSPAGSRPTTSG